MLDGGLSHGAIFAYFLLQHKVQFGHKTITKVTAVRPENDNDIDLADTSLVFHVADAPEPPPDEEESLNEKLHDGHMVEMIV
jgi:hypothetical protein